MNIQRKQYHSIPLRSTQAKQALTRKTTGEVQTRGTQPQTQAPTKRQSYVSQRNMPAMPDENQQFSIAPLPKSAVRYTDAYGREVLQQGKQRLVIQRRKARRRFHWLVPASAAAMVTIGLLFAGNAVFSAIQANQLNVQYGYPRFYQTDAIVGHDDSKAHPSHFIFENLNAQVVIVEIPGGNLAKAQIIGGPHLFGNDASDQPVTASFADVNGDGKLDIVLHIEGQNIILLNTGTSFKPEQ
jgi:hypothetical protein